MSNIISSAIFCARNVDKAEDQGKVGRWGVAAGQMKKVTDYVSTLDNSLGKGTKATIDTLHTVAKSEKLLDFAGKAVDFASKNINPLICVSAGIDVLNSDDKQSAVVTNTTALASMFAVEDLMKKHMDKVPKMKCMKSIVEKFAKFEKENKCEGKIGTIIHGVAFVAGSCTAYNIGQQFGNLLIGKPAVQK